MTTRMTTFTLCVSLLGQQVKEGKIGSNAQNARDELIWSTQALGRVRHTPVTTVILT